MRSPGREQSLGFPSLSGADRKVAEAFGLAADQDEIFGRQPFILAPGTVNAGGRAMPTGKGTDRLSGHWQFATGVCHADWVIVSGQIEGDEKERIRQFLVPIDEVEVKDTWYVDGMAATGSRDIVANDVTVPEARVTLLPPHVLARTCWRARAGAPGRLRFLDQELQRIHRAIHMICAHTVFDVDLVAEGVGRALVAARSAGADENP